MLAVLLVLATEIGLRALGAFEKTPYWTGRAEYFAAAESIERDGPAEICVIGSSRPRDGILTGPIREACRRQLGTDVRVQNYSCAGATPLVVKFVVRRLLRGGSKPRLVLYGVSPLYVGPDACGSGIPRQFIDWQDWRLMAREDGPDALRFLSCAAENEARKSIMLCRMREGIGPVIYGYRYFGKIRYGPYDGEIPLFHQRFRGGSLVDRPIGEERVRLYVSRYLKDGRYRVSRKALKCLKEVQEICAQANVKLVIFEMPYSDFVTRLLPENTFPDFYRAMTRLSQETGGRFVTVTDMKLAVEDEDFQDQSHLNHRGATKLTRALIRHEIVPFLTADDSQR